ncbi:hypothetical protein F5Y12DRAFT_712674 [Xylaria sp. FL1777]|nr:hypothetical protein F5Y12DRAFT_712674 [Xylaria sp. FL1777]
MRELGKPSRQFLKLCQSRPILSRALVPILVVPRCSYSSSSTSNASLPGKAGIDIEAIKAEMLGRPPQVHYDTMHPIKSYLLSKALSDVLPEECYAKQQISKETLYNEHHEPPLVPEGHHFVYFPLHLRGSELCPDGTDPYHSPRGGTPFTRRMWAGGSIRDLWGMRLDKMNAVCFERIVDAKVQGPAGAEKIFVEVLREYVTEADIVRPLDVESKTLNESHGDPHNLDSAALASSSMGSDPNMLHYPLKGITEHRTLVFMREPSEKDKKTNLKKKQRVVKAPNKPEYAVTVTPTPTLLFHYSALTYNAHRIHLDRSYCREVEGYRDLLVHGPLSVTLMLSVLASRLAHDENRSELIDSVEYRHLAPLYVGQPMRICVARQRPRGSKGAKKTSDGEEQRRRAGENLAEEETAAAAAATTAGLEAQGNKWDVWVENQDGGLCVRGTAETVDTRRGRRS